MDATREVLEIHLISLDTCGCDVHQSVQLTTPDFDLNIDALLDMDSSNDDDIVASYEDDDVVSQPLPPKSKKITEKSKSNSKRIVNTSTEKMGDSCGTLMDKWLQRRTITVAAEETSPVEVNEAEEFHFDRDMNPSPSPPQASPLHGYSTIDVRAGPASLRKQRQAPSVSRNFSLGTKATSGYSAESVLPGHRSVSSETGPTPKKSLDSSARQDVPEPPSKRSRDSAIAAHVNELNSRRATKATLAPRSLVPRVPLPSFEQFAYNPQLATSSRIAETLRESLPNQFGGSSARLRQPQTFTAGFGGQGQQFPKTHDFLTSEDRFDSRSQQSRLDTSSRPDTVERHSHAPFERTRCPLERWEQGRSVPSWEVASSAQYTEMSSASGYDHLFADQDALDFGPRMSRAPHMIDRHRPTIGHAAGQRTGSQGQRQGQIRGERALPMSRGDMQWHSRLASSNGSQPFLHVNTSHQTHHAARDGDVSRGKSRWAAGSTGFDALFGSD